MITVGIDEVGRGCWAGPLVAGAVILTSAMEGLTDSKQLSAVRRDTFATEIHRYHHVGLGWVGPGEIDEHGLTWAVRTAMERALRGITVQYDEIIIDGNYNFLQDNPRVRTVIAGDSLIPAVSAASIVAKVARDTYMATKLHEQYPEYMFDKHVGYGTKLHRAMLQEYGVTAEHRKSYKPIKQIMDMP